MSFHIADGCSWHVRHHADRRARAVAVGELVVDDGDRAEDAERGLRVADAGAAVDVAERDVAEGQGSSLPNGMLTFVFSTSCTSLSSSP